MSKTTDNAVGFGLGILAGVLCGVAAGALLSPKSGEEMRKELVTTAKKIADENSPSSKLNTEAFARLQYTIESQFNKIIDAIKANKMAAAKQREELESAYKY